MSVTVLGNKSSAKIKSTTTKISSVLMTISVLMNISLEAEEPSSHSQLQNTTVWDSKVEVSPLYKQQLNPEASSES